MDPQIQKADLKICASYMTLIHLIQSKGSPAKTHSAPNLHDLIPCVHIATSGTCGVENMEAERADPDRKPSSAEQDIAAALRFPGIQIHTEAVTALYPDEAAAQPPPSDRPCRAPSSVVTPSITASAPLTTVPDPSRSQPMPDFRSHAFGSNNEQPLDHDKDTVNILIKLIHRQRGLVGPDTVVFTATCPDFKGGKVIVKLSWVVRGRVPEYHFVEQAREAEESLPGLFNNLPKIPCFEGFPGTDDEEDRVLRAVVMTVLHPITDLKTESSLKCAIRGIAKCHHWLVTEPRILHRDISLKNLMYREIGGSIHGVLNNPDLAVSLQGDEEGGINGCIQRGRTGTHPFVAIDLSGTSLDPSAKPMHYVRHDWESILWVVAWLISRYDGGKEVTRRHQRWIENIRMGRGEKISYLYDFNYPATRSFVGLRLVWVAELCGLIIDAKSNETKHRCSLNTHNCHQNESPKPAAFDFETAGGAFTWEKFWHILEQ